MELHPRSNDTKKTRITRKSAFIMIGILLLVIIATVFLRQALVKDDAVETTLQTARVRTGDIVITASGAGTVVPASQVEMGFRSGGTLIELNVAIGDPVKSGDVLACLDGSLQNRADYDALFSPSSIAQAEAKVVLAQNAFNTAESRLIALLSPSVYYYETQLADVRSALEAIQADPLAGDSARVEAQNAVERAQADLDAALINSDSAVSDETIVLARADLEEARLALEDAEVALEILKTGPEALASPLIMIGSQTTRLEQARRAVKDSCLAAPFDGTVTSLSAVIGQTVGTGPIIRIASTQDMLVRFYLDETDLDKAALGNRVKLTFDAYPDLLLEGAIVIVEPSLDFVDGTPVVVVWVSLPNTAAVPILAGMTVEAEVIAHEAFGALLLPIQALRELEPGSYAVFVVQEDGTLLLTPVVTGLRDYANVQILDGLQAGDLVSTGTVETE